MLLLRKRATPTGITLSAKTSYAAQVTPQCYPILLMSKSSLSIPCAPLAINVQPVRKGCSISTVQLFNFGGLGVFSRRNIQAPNHMLAFSPMVTSPISAALGAIKAEAAMFGFFR
ncbi:hypothetical protein [Paradesulfitobacterium aromaticivorans]